MQVYLEAGRKRTFAGAIEWPGWCRSGRSETEALEVLINTASRYRQAISTSRIAFEPPQAPADLEVVERLAGSASTDFGAPGEIPTADRRSMDEMELARSSALLAAMFDVLEGVVRATGHAELRKGPRGGGRDLQDILKHVLEANAAYLRQLGRTLAQVPDAAQPFRAIEEARTASLSALESAARGELPVVGPRGGQRWPPRYFTRRAAWHILDHAWEIEDRRLPE